MKDNFLEVTVDQEWLLIENLSLYHCMYKAMKVQYSDSFLFCGFPNYGFI